MSKSVNKLRAARKTTQKTVNTDEVFKSNFDRPTLDNILLDDELRSFIPALKGEELDLLEQSIAQEGVRDALLVWYNDENVPVLIDGYNRYHIIKKLEQQGVSSRYHIKSIEFSSKEAVKDWMIMNQLGRRNLTAEQRSYLRGLRYHREKEKHGGDRKSSDQNDHLKTSARLAMEYKVGEATIRRDSEYAIGLEKIGASNAELKRSILDGNTKISKSIVQQLSRKADQPDAPFSSIKAITSFVSPPKFKTDKKGAQTFESTRDQMVMKLRKMSAESDPKEVATIRKLLQKLEGYLQK